MYYNWKYIIVLINSPIIDINPKLIVSIWEHQYCIVVTLFHLEGIRQVILLPEKSQTVNYSLHLQYIYCMYTNNKATDNRLAHKKPHKRTKKTHKCCNAMYCY